MIKLFNLLKESLYGRYSRPRGTPMNSYWGGHDNAVRMFKTETEKSKLAAIKYLRNEIQRLQKEKINNYTTSSDRIVIDTNLDKALIALEKAENSIYQGEMNAAHWLCDHALNFFHETVDMLASLYIKNYKE